VQAAIDGGEPLLLGGRHGLAIDAEPEVDATLVAVRRGQQTAVRIENRGQSIVLPGGSRILPGMSHELRLPAQFWLGRTTVYVQGADSVCPHDAALQPFPRLGDDPQRLAGVMKKLGSAPSSHTLAYWFDALGRLQRCASGSRDFYQAAAAALFDPGGLDAGIIVLRESGHWRIAASYVSHPDPAIVVRRTVLEQLERQPQTIYHDARQLSERTDSCQGFVVASPIVDSGGELVGAAYGVRFDHASNSRRGIRPLEAQFSQAVADAVSAGFCRAAREAEVVRLRTRLEQVFPPSVTHELERNPRLLEGDQREVTILFGDLRGFTSLAERLSVRESYHLLADVMDALTNIVSEHGGVLIDYFGDGLAAFWNAPLPQSGHAELACQAALAMCEVLPEISHDWHAITGRPLRLGIGIHTGEAMVGNAGSRSRIKYGPRGNAMNVASRVQTATKQFEAPILLTRATADQLTGSLPIRSVGPTQFDGLADAVELFALLRGGENAAVESSHFLGRSAIS
jgi:adenylate cyclase